eukprot:m51a1_g10312 hypothetical protein (280) ;mRNA; f:91158-92187
MLRVRVTYRRDTFDVEVPADCPAPALRSAVVSRTGVAPAFMLLEQLPEDCEGPKARAAAVRAGQGPRVPPEALGEMPDHVVQVLAAFLPIADIARLARTCRRLACACSREPLWLAVYGREFGVDTRLASSAECARVARAAASYSAATGLCLPGALPAPLPQHLLDACERSRAEAARRAPVAPSGSVWKAMTLERTAAEARLAAGAPVERRALWPCGAVAYDACSATLACAPRGSGPVAVFDLDRSPGRLRTKLVVDAASGSAPRCPGAARAPSSAPTST